MKIYRDEGSNIERLGRQELIDLKVLDQALLLVTGKAEDEQEMEGEELIQRKEGKEIHKGKVDYKMGSLSMKTENSIFNPKEMSFSSQQHHHIVRRNKARRNTSIGILSETRLLLNNIKAEINRWGEVAEHNWTHEYMVLFMEQNKEHLRMLDCKQFTLKKMNEILFKRREFIKTYYTDPLRAKRTLDTVMSKYLGKCLRTMAAGDIFGERALESSAPRSASIVAESDCE